MRQPALQAKFEAYAEYYERRLYRRDHDHGPALLIVTQRAADEARILEAIRIAGLEDGANFTIRLTNGAAINDPSNSDGIRGPIWRRMGCGGYVRDPWP